MNPSTLDFVARELCYRHSKDPRSDSMPSKADIELKTGALELLSADIGEQQIFRLAELDTGALMGILRSPDSYSPGYIRVLKDTTVDSSSFYGKNSPPFESWYPTCNDFNDRKTALTKFLSRYIGNNSRILEIASGTGTVLDIFGDKWKRNLVQTDWNEISCRITKEKGGRPVVADFYRLPFADGSFDVIFSMDCIDYARDPAAVLEEAQRLLSLKGRFIHFETGHKDPEDITRAFLRKAGLIMNTGQPTWHCPASGTMYKYWDPATDTESIAGPKTIGVVLERLMPDSFSVLWNDYIRITGLFSLLFAGGQSGLHAFGAAFAAQKLSE